MARFSEFILSGGRGVPRDNAENERDPNRRNRCDPPDPHQRKRNRESEGITLN